MKKFVIYKKFIKIDYLDDHAKSIFDGRNQSTL